MQVTFQLGRRAGDDRYRFRVFGRPMAFLLVPLAVLSVVMFLVFAGKYIRDSYAPYEGRVRAVRTSWLDWLTFESQDYEHLIIETPTGKTIDRFLSMQIRVLQRIEVGDYVLKEKGFHRHPRAQGKETVAPLLDNAQKR